MARSTAVNRDWQDAYLSAEFRVNVRRSHQSFRPDKLPVRDATRNIAELIATRFPL